MTKLVHALAILGCALLGAGCSDADVTETASDQDISAPSAESIPADDDVVFDLEPGEMPGEYAHKSKRVVMHGWGLKSHLAAIPGTSPQQFGGIADRTSYASYADWFGQRLGPCGDSPASDGVFPACAVPRTASRARTYKLDTTSCSMLSATQRGDLSIGINDAMSILSNDTSWTLTATTGTADIVVSCATSGERAMMQATRADGSVVRAMAAFHAGNLTLNDTTVSPFAAVDACSGSPPNYAHQAHVYYTYQSGRVLINHEALLNKLTAFSFAAGSTQARNFSRSVVLHEMLHWFGFMHQFDENNSVEYKNPLYYKIEQTAGSDYGTSIIRANVRKTMKDFKDDNLSDTVIFNNLSCYLPQSRGSGNPDSAEYGTEQPQGVHANFTTNKTYGVRTGAGHLSCDFFASGQVCAVPSNKDIHWCFGGGLTTLFKQEVAGQGMLNVPGLFGTNPGPITDFPGGWRWLYHTSCNDPDVEVVIGKASCGGTDSSNIDGYACLVFPQTPGSANILGKEDTAGFGLPGTYFSWGANSGYLLLNIDTDDLDRIGPFANEDRRQVAQHAIQLGMLWVMGIGTRTDVTNRVTSRAVLPRAKSGHVVGQYNWLALSPGEACRLGDLRLEPDMNFQTGFYCGDD